MRRAKLVLGVLVLALLLALLDRESGLRRWHALRGDLAAAQVRIAALRTDLAALEAQRGGLADDPFAQERAIRERLDWALPGEIVVRERGALPSEPPR